MPCDFSILGRGYPTPSEDGLLLSFLGIWLIATIWADFVCKVAVGGGRDQEVEKEEEGGK